MPSLFKVPSKRSNNYETSLVSAKYKYSISLFNYVWDMKYMTLTLFWSREILRKLVTTRREMNFLFSEWGVDEKLTIANIYIYIYISHSKELLNQKFDIFNGRRHKHK